MTADSVWARAAVRALLVRAALAAAEELRLIARSIGGGR